MVMSYLWTGLIFLSVFSAHLLDRGQMLSAAVPKGAAAGIQLAISVAGSICLWSGVGRLMKEAGMTALLSRCLRPLLFKLFPSTKQDKPLAGFISANICANFLGLGNAATPMGIHAAQRLKQDDTASDELCRLIVLNTASIQLIPTNVAAIRGSLGCDSPFDILPAVWFSSFVSASLGLAMAWILGKVWKND